MSSYDSFKQSPLRQFQQSPLKQRDSNREVNRCPRLDSQIAMPAWSIDFDGSLSPPTTGTIEISDDGFSAPAWDVSVPKFWRGRWQWTFQIDLGDVPVGPNISPSVGGRVFSIELLASDASGWRAPILWIFKDADNNMTLDWGLGTNLSNGAGMPFSQAVFPNNSYTKTFETHWVSVNPCYFQLLIDRKDSVIGWGSDVTAYGISGARLSS